MTPWRIRSRMMNGHETLRETMTRFEGYEKIIIPLNSGSHWWLLLVERSSKILTVYDSICGRRDHEYHIKIQRALGAGWRIEIKSDVRIPFFFFFFFLNKKKQYLPNLST